MKLFYVKKRADDRVYLDIEPPVGTEQVLNEIKATNWISARKKCRINDIELYVHEVGHGYYEGLRST